MQAYICTACGMQYSRQARGPAARLPRLPGGAPVRAAGRPGLDHARRPCACAMESTPGARREPGLIGIGSQPGLRHRPARPAPALTPNGNVLWDCISLIDEATVTLIKGLGGLNAIAISHPHFYTTLGEWSRAFGGVPVYTSMPTMRAGSCAPSPCVRALAGRHPRAAAGRDADPRRRPFPGRRHAALG